MLTKSLPLCVAPGCCLLVALAGCGGPPGYEAMRNRPAVAAPASPVPSVRRKALVPRPPAPKRTPTPPAAPAPPALVDAAVVTVARGETLYAVARRTGADLRSLIEANDLQPPYALRVGQQLKVPAARYYVVQRGDTLSDIADRFDVSLSQLVRLNGIAPPYGIQLGQRLRLPGDSDAKPPTPQPATPDAAKATPQRKAEDTPKSVAALVLAQAAAKKPPEHSPVPPAKPGPAPQPAVTLATPAPRAAPSAQAIDAATSPLVRASISFAWPLDGRILSRFGPKEGGRRNDGVNIAATNGQAVRAAADGIVAYAGDNLTSFGWLLLIKHADGWVTAYGHNSQLLVERGQTVRRGDVIARAGATGAVDSPQLHFQVRRGRRAIDPLSVLPLRS